MNLVLEGWIVYAVPLALLSGPMWFFGRRRVRWTIWDFGVLVLPFVAWVLLTVLSESRGSTDEAFFFGYIGPAILGAMLGFAPLARILIWRENSRRIVPVLAVFFVGLPAALWTIVRFFDGR